VSRELKKQGTDQAFSGILKRLIMVQPEHFLQPQAKRLVWAH
jgi:hypothetical protein